MGKGDIVDLLRKRRDWLDSTSISSHLGISSNSVTTSLRYMRAHDMEIEWKKVSQEKRKGKFVYAYKQ